MLTRTLNFTVAHVFFCVFNITYHFCHSFSVAIVFTLLFGARSAPKFFILIFFQLSRGRNLITTSLHGHLSLIPTLFRTEELEE